LTVLVVLLGALVGARLRPIVAVGVAAAAGGAVGVATSSAVGFACAAGVAAALSAWCAARGAPWWLAAPLTAAAALLPGPHRVALPPFDLMFASYTSAQPPTVLAATTLLAAAWITALLVMTIDGSPQAPPSR
jgi:hypothetical protein